MNQTITFEINGRIYDISANNDFAEYLKSQILEDFNLSNNKSAKNLLQAYVKAKHELFKQEQEMEDVADIIYNKCFFTKTNIRK